VENETETETEKYFTTEITLARSTSVSIVSKHLTEESEAGIRRTWALNSCIVVCV